jgi:dinuclear metal center YbgI/SA1388 family protein
MDRSELVGYMDELLRTTQIVDASQNGLQVEGPDHVETVAFAVDASVATIRGAIDAGAQMLVVHHGLFWDKPIRITGPLYKRIKLLIEGKCALYASHLPLDMHPEFGNNIALARAIGVVNPQPFGEYHGVIIGFGGHLDNPTSPLDLRTRIETVTGELCKAIARTEFSSKVAIVSGDGSSLLEDAACEGYDTFITGESKHASFHVAAEYGINLIFGGHYATETLGVKSLMDHLSRKFGLKGSFIDVPTGM